MKWVEQFLDLAVSISLEVPSNALHRAFPLRRRSLGLRSRNQRTRTSQQFLFAPAKCARRFSRKLRSDASSRKVFS
jgi:hypothetical protein